MALDAAAFKKRTFTAILFAVVMLAGLLLNRWSFILLFVIIHFGCWYEYLKLMKLIRNARPILYILLGLLYISVPAVLMICLRITPVNHTLRMDDDYLKVIPCGIIFSIWINDTMAYISGSFIGKTPFSKISPKKTWEGTIGGALLCVIAIGLIGWAVNIYSIKDWIIISSICAVFGTAGDLLESKLKRMAGVKDSGSLLPGHGGFLDRFDSWLLATPFVWIYVYFLMG
jgi:phosphatidate cytidylyltransferase